MLFKIVNLAALLLVSSTREISRQEENALLEVTDLVYMDISIDDKPKGTMVIGLFGK